LLLDGFPNAAPHSIDGYLKSLAATLAQYPQELALECADPRTGIARTFKFKAPNIADVIEWCDRRLDLYTKAAKWQPRALPKPAPVATPEMRERVLSFLRTLADRFRAAPDPLAQMRTAAHAEIAARRSALGGTAPGVPSNAQLREIYARKGENHETTDPARARDSRADVGAGE
jgi:hypothetical protein